MRSKRLYRSKEALPRLPKCQHLAPNRLRLTRLLLATHPRDHAISAALIAAVDDIHPRRHHRVALRLGDVLDDVNGLRRADLAAQVNLQYKSRPSDVGQKVAILRQVNQEPKL